MLVTNDDGISAPGLEVAEEIARKAIKVASDICVFTNNNITVEKV